MRIWHSNISLIPMDFFMKFGNKLAKALIGKSYINDDSCTSPSKTKKISHILEITSAYATEYEKQMVCTEKFRYHQYICHWPKSDKITRTYCSCSLVTWLCKQHHQIHVLEKCRRNNVTRWIQFSFFHFYCELIFIKSPILTHFNSSFQWTYQ